MTQLVIGSKGQVGSALIEVLSEKYEVSGIDINESIPHQFDVLHICIPYNDRFDSATATYIEQYLAPDGLVIIHSTVPLGTSAKFNAVHSPIRGVHPNLAGGIRTFTKFFGGPRAAEAAWIFAQLGIEAVTSPRAEDTEAMKLWDTTYYGWNIVFEKAVKAYCDKHGLDFRVVYTWANEGYNEGYAKLGMSNVQRPVLKDYPGKIGGHCVIPNARLLGLEEDVADFILQKNEEY
jgi:nucleoside-diphosphate-sugar epimerase